MKEHEKRFADRIRAVNEASNALANTASRFGSSVRHAWGEMEKSTSEYGMRLAQSIQETVQPLTRFDGSPTFSNTEKYQQQSVQALNKIILTVRKYVPKLHRGLKVEMAALNTALARLENAVRQLGEALDESPGGKIEALQRDAMLLTGKQNELLKLRNEEKTESNSLETLSGREKQLMAEEEALTSDAEFSELKRYEDKMRSNDEEIRQFFQPVMKPLVKLERAASAKETAAIDIKTLHGLLETPVETVATGQSFSIIQLLDQLDEALGHGQMEIEDRKRRKAQETIQQARNGSVEAMRQEYLATQANIQETLRQLRASGLLEKRDKIRDFLYKTRAEKEDLDRRRRDVQRRIDDLARDISKHGAGLESHIHKLSHKTITIRAS